MQLSDFDYSLPEELIAQVPAERRDASRLLHVDAVGGLVDRMFTDLPALLRPDDLLVFNDTKVMPARLYGEKSTGGKVEILIERLTAPDEALAHIRASKSPKPGSVILIGENEIAVGDREGDLFALALPHGDFQQLMAAHGHMPLPPYIARADTGFDQDRYQTVYARRSGAVAAPTAGLHFDQAMLGRLVEKGVRMAHVTLHVGAGTFQPVRVDSIDDHEMHSEWLEVDETVCTAVQQTRERGGRVIAVGTTTIRSLETAAGSGELQPYRGETQLFIRPGYQFNVADAMVTNFHLPQSTLLMLVSAFSGYESIMRAYRHAVDDRYRFFSYGDAMFLEKTSA